jgi:hypothetical protein
MAQPYPVTPEPARLSRVTEGHFHGVIGTQAAGWLWPDSRLLRSAWTRGVPINIEVADEGIVLSPRTRFLRGKRWVPVTLTWEELGDASETSRGHTGRTGGLTLHETFEVTLKVVGSRTADFRVPVGASSFLPHFPSDVDVVGEAGFAPLVITMPHGGELAAAVRARANGPQLRT